MRSACKLSASAGRLALVVVAVSLMGCSLFKKKDADYVPDVPPDQLYNEGLYLLNHNQDYAGAAKKFP